MNFATLATFWGVPVALTGFFFWLIQIRISKQAKQREKLEVEKEQKALEREAHREKLILMLMQSVRATSVLSEATAKAVQRIPEAKCNGDMTNALKIASEIQSKQREFLFELGIHSIYEE